MNTYSVTFVITGMISPKVKFINRGYCSYEVKSISTGSNNCAFSSNCCRLNCICLTLGGYSKCIN